jgi:phosphatidylglycerophosphate synthase
MERKRSVIHSVEGKLLDFCHHRPRAFWGSFALNLVCQGAAVLEVYLILRLMGVPVSVFVALAAEALTKLVNVAGMFNPGNIGTYEGGNMLIGRMLGMSATTGLTLAFARRFRGIFWAAAGAVCLLVLSRAKKRDSSDNITPSAVPATKNVQPPTNGGEPAHRSHVVVILANGSDGRGGFGTTRPQVGALPVLLRAILGARKAGAARIAVATQPETGRSLRLELLRTGRLPESIEWFELGPGETSLPSLLTQLLDERASHVVLVDGDRTYHPSLQQRAGDWNGEGALAMVTDGQLAGVYAFSRSAATDLAAHGPASAGSLEELDEWFSSTHTVERLIVPGDKWQRILTPQDRLLAERKLDAWLVKPTDGIFARMNRRVSIPISRQIIRFPITPNMVSLFTLGVSFLSGLYFAFGGYRNMLIGALLGLFASILDGCDGEVARLKLQESAFGCWLETICDYLYYLFMFAGMTVGLLRTSGTRAYLVWGVLLLCGALASFLVTGWQRHRLAAERPEQLLGIWHAQAARRRSNPLLYLGRHTEFIVRRCFLPYAILFFALLNITNVAFILAALGANLVWSIALYSHFRFSVAPSTAVRPPAAA